MHIICIQSQPCQENSDFMFNSLIDGLDSGGAGAWATGMGTGSTFFRLLLPDSPDALEVDDLFAFTDAFLLTDPLATGVSACPFSIFS
jgi:hypothetical protein